MAKKLEVSFLVDGEKTVIKGHRFNDDNGDNNSFFTWEQDKVMTGDEVIIFAKSMLSPDEQDIEVQMVVDASEPK